MDQFGKPVPPEEIPLSVRLFRAFFGAIFYGFLFIPFVFATLQQTMIDHKAIDPFNPTDKVNGSAWCSGFVFLFSIGAYCLVAFTSMPESWYAPGSGQLVMLFAAVVLAIFVFVIIPGETTFAVVQLLNVARVWPIVNYGDAMIKLLLLREHWKRSPPDGRSAEKQAQLDADVEAKRAPQYRCIVERRP